MLFKKWKLEMFKKHVKEESGFTLIETVIAIGVVALISNVFLSGFVSANENSEVANVISHMDRMTTQAKETFQSHPDEVLRNSMNSGDAKFAPYTDYAMTFKMDANGAGEPPTVSYTKYYGENLNTNASLIETDPDAVYKVQLIISPKAVAKVKGFSFQTNKYILEANVFRKQNGVFNQEKMYTKTFEFDQIETKIFENLERNIKIDYDANGGKIVLAGATTADSTYSQMYYKGESLYSRKTITAVKPNKRFIGWSEQKDGDVPELIDPATYKITENKKLYAQYLNINEYRIDFRIRENDGEFWSGMNSNRNVISYQKDFVNDTKKPTIKEIDNRTEYMFKGNVVAKRGSKFVGWEDIKGNRVNVNTKVEEAYLVVYPVWEDLDYGRTEVVSLNLKLNLNNVKATDRNGNETSRLYATYPFTKMEYSLTYIESTDMFRLKQTEKIHDPNNAYGGTLGSAKHGDIISEKQFDMYGTNPALTLVSKNNQYYQTLTEYIKDKLIDKSNPSFMIGDITLDVDIPAFEANTTEYYHSKVVGGPNNGSSIRYAELTKSTGGTLSEGQVQTLFQRVQGVKEPSFVFTNDKPMEDKDSVTKLNKLVKKICKQDTLYDDNFVNQGYVSFENNDSKKHRTSNPNEDGTDGGIAVTTPEEFVSYGKGVKMAPKDFTYYLPTDDFHQDWLVRYNFKLDLEQYVDLVNNKLMVRVRCGYYADKDDILLPSISGHTLCYDGDWAEFVVSDYYNPKDNSFAYIENAKIGLTRTSILNSVSMPGFNGNLSKSKASMNVNFRSIYPNVTEGVMNEWKAQNIRGRDNIYNTFLETIVASNKDVKFDINDTHLKETALLTIFGGNSFIPTRGRELAVGGPTVRDLFDFGEGDIAKVNFKGDDSTVDKSKQKTTLNTEDMKKLKSKYTNSSDGLKVQILGHKISGVVGGSWENYRLSKRVLGPEKKPSGFAGTTDEAREAQWELYDIIVDVKTTPKTPTPTDTAPYEQDFGYTRKERNTRLPYNTFNDVGGSGLNYLPPFVLCIDRN